MRYSRAIPNIKKIIEKITGRKPGSISLETQFEDLDMEEDDIALAVMAVENIYRKQDYPREIPVKSFKSVRDLIEYVFSPYLFKRKLLQTDFKTGRDIV